MALTINLPPEMERRFLELCEKTGYSVDRLATIFMGAIIPPEPEGELPVADHELPDEESMWGQIQPIVEKLDRLSPPGPVRTEPFEPFADLRPSAVKEAG